MKYLTEILMFASWPLFIYISYKVCAWVIAKFENKNS